MCLPRLYPWFDLLWKIVFEMLGGTEWAVESSSRLAVAQLFFGQGLTSPTLEALVTVERVLVSHTIPTRFGSNGSPSRVSSVSLI